MKPPASAKWYFSILTDRRGIEPKYRVKAILSTGRKVYDSYYDRTYNSKQKAQSRVKELQREQTRGSNRIKFSDYSSDYVRLNSNAKKWGKNHESAVSRYLSEFSKYLETHKAVYIDEIRESHIEDFLTNFNHQKIRMRNIRLTHILAVLRKAHRDKLINELPEVKQAKEKDRVKTKAFSQSESKAIFAFILKNYEWAFLPIVFASMTGLRSDELCSLEWQFIKDNEIIIPANITKSSKERQIPISDSIREIIDNLKRSDKDNFVFRNKSGNKLNAFHLSHTFTKVMRGLGYGEGYVLHSLRATFITNALAQGVDSVALMDIVGHRQLSTTQGYTSPFRESKKAIMSKVPSLFELTGYKTEKKKAEEAKAEEERKQKALDEAVKGIRANRQNKPDRLDDIFSIKPE